MEIDSMIIKEIADLCGVDNRTVTRWIDNLCESPDKISGGGEHFHSIKQKTLKASQTGTTAHFAIDEVFTIIRAGGRHTLVDALTGKLRFKQNNSVINRHQEKIKSEITAHKIIIRELKSIIQQQQTLIQKQSEFIKKEELG